jgi:hypothetical protein
VKGHILPLLGWKPLIGVVHLPPLPSIGRPSDLERIVEYAVEEARKLESAGFDAVLIENYGDAPYAPEGVDALGLASLTAIAREIARSVSLPVGLNILRNGGVQAAATAYASGARFVRINGLCEVRVSVEGVWGALAHDVWAILRSLTRKIAVLADVNVKHSYPLHSDVKGWRIVRDCVERASPDAIVVTGAETGKPPDPGYVASIRGLAGIPVIVGSGIDSSNIRAYWSIADGFIVGTSVKVGGRTHNPIDLRAAKELAEKAKELRAREAQRE